MQEIVNGERQYINQIQDLNPETMPMLNFEDSTC